MADTKIQFKLGAIEFSGEGEKEWLEAQLDKILEKAPQLINIIPTPPPAGVGTSVGSHTPIGLDPSIAQQPLATFLRAKNATTNQVKKFLATAIWLESKGKNRLNTNDITQALKDSNQARLSNASDSLNKNINKGFCDKDGKEFFVTAEGKNSL